MMFTYRGRQLNIDEKLKEDYEKETGAYLTSYDIDRWIDVYFEFDPEIEQEEFGLLTNKQIENLVHRCMKKEV